MQVAWKWRRPEQCLWTATLRNADAALRLEERLTLEGIYGNSLHSDAGFVEEMVAMNLRLPMALHLHAVSNAHHTHTYKNDM